MVKTVIENRQDLIVEGCYIPFDWRRNFDESYLPFIRFLCLAMTDAYIDAHFEDIRQHASDIETRLEDDCTIDGLKADNRSVVEGYGKTGEPVVLIRSDYGQTINAVLEDMAN